jgi:hypothetical protein
MDSGRSVTSWTVFTIQTMSSAALSRPGPVLMSRALAPASTFLYTNSWSLAASLLSMARPTTLNIPLIFSLMTIMGNPPAA